LCRAVKVLCVAADEASLADLKRAAVGADWELTSGATSEEGALAQLEDRPHVMVVWGLFPDLMQAARQLRPALRIVGSVGVIGADSVVESLDEVRGAIAGLPRPGGPVGP